MQQLCNPKAEVKKGPALEIGWCGIHQSSFRSIQTCSPLATTNPKNSGHEQGRSDLRSAQPI